MSISVVKAYDAYPLTKDNMNNLEINAKRVGYQQGYEQAMQNFMEKAYNWLRYNTMRELVLDSESTELVDDFIEQFKNYMQN